MPCWLTNSDAYTLSVQDRMEEARLAAEEAQRAAEEARRRQRALDLLSGKAFKEELEGLTDQMDTLLEELGQNLEPFLSHNLHEREDELKNRILELKSRPLDESEQARLKVLELELRSTQKIHQAKHEDDEETLLASLDGSLEASRMLMQAAEKFDALYTKATEELSPAERRLLDEELEEVLDEDDLESYFHKAHPQESPADEDTHLETADEDAEMVLAYKGREPVNYLSR